MLVVNYDSVQLMLEIAQTVYSFIFQIVVQTNDFRADNLKLQSAVPNRVKKEKSWQNVVRRCEKVTRSQENLSHDNGAC